MDGEKLMNMKEASAWLLQEYGLKRSARTIYGWVYYARASGLRLEATAVGARYYTTPGALRRYMGACAREMGAQELHLGPTATERLADAQRQQQRLEAEAQAGARNGRARRGQQ